jgi:sulfur-oxidizing protein SoxZ
MNTDQGKIRARLDDGIIAVKVLIRHPMETGSRKHPSTDEIIPRHYIREVVCEHNGKPVLTMDWGWGISANPYLSFSIREGAPGDRVTVRWTDDKEQSASLETSVA